MELVVIATRGDECVSLALGIYVPAFLRRFSVLDKPGPAKCLILASGSPRRADLLTSTGYDFSVLKPDIDETILPGEEPRCYVSRMSLEKFDRAISTSDLAASAIFIAADTIVVVDQEILGKPGDRQQGLMMLLKLSGRAHRVLTSVCLGNQADKRQFVVETIVEFRTLTRKECEAYWETGEPVDKAGGYAAQGIGSVFVSEFHGSYTNVVGLPMTETAKVLAEFGISVL